MTTVYTTAELESALTSGEKHLIAKGEVAEELRKQYNRKKAIKTGGILVALAGLAAAPFTGGTSLLATLGAPGLTVGALTISAAELAILCGTSIALAAILKGRKVKVKFNDDGTVELDVE